MPRSIPYKESNNRFATKWMKNALKSIGITTKDVLTEIAPNTSEFVFTGANVSKDIFGVLTRNKQSIDRVNNALTQNKYTKAFQTAYKNALADIKSGNLNNTERIFESFGSDDQGGGFSFGEDDQSVSIDTGTPAAIATLSSQMAENTTAQVKMMKASTDAMISANAAAMFQSKQIGSEIISKLNNIDNHLATLVEFNNTNMSQYIKASMAYMERTGAAIAPTEEEKKKLGISDVLNSRSGFDFKNYKKLVSQQFKEYFSGTTVGMINDMLTPETLNLLASNPIGFMSKALIPKLMPAMMAESMKAVEDSFNDFLPQALMNLYTNATKNTIGGMTGELIRGLGETFGIKPANRKNHGDFNTKNAKIERGPIPFDGETKHAITAVITKELRDQTAYLRVIAEHFDRHAVDKASGYKTYWDWNTNSYVDKSGVDMTIATKFTDAIAQAFDNTTFGKTLRQFANTRSNEADQKSMNNAINQLYTLIERLDPESALDPRQMEKLVKQLSLDKAGKRVLNNQIKQLYDNNNLGYYSARTGKLAATNAVNSAREDIFKNYNNYNLLDSSFNREMSPEEFDKLIDASLGYDKKTKKDNRRYNGSDAAPSRIGNLVGTYGKNIITSGADYAVKGMIALATGNSQALKGIATNIINNVGNVLKDTLTGLGTKASDILFGSKNQETGQRENGLFSTVINQTRDAFLGKEKEDGTREGGIVGTIKNSFNLGLNGWMEAFFDRKEGETDEEMKKRLKGEIEARMPNTTKGALGGALIGGILGHPFIGAAIGGASGFMIKSETFQKWLFGDDIDPDDPTKGKTGGLISREIQEYFKKNKMDIAKNTGIGAVTGGIMGMFVGGPITGAMLGAATGLVSKTGMFQRFLFGDEKSGHKGLITGVREAFGKGAGKYTDSELKSIGMKGIGAIGGAAFASFASAHGLLGAMMFPGGPIGGAIAGLALTIKAQEGSIRKWLFGGDKDDKGFTKNGVLGKIANNINTAIINPLRTELKFHIGNLFNRIEHHVLTPISLLSQFVAKRTVDLFKTGTGLLAALATAPFKLLNNVLGGRLMDLAKIPLGLASGAATAAGRVLSAPGRAVMGILGKFDPDLYAQGLGAKESFRENREAIRQGRKLDKEFDKRDREISKATKGRYGEDTPEARAYIRRNNPRMYKKLFLDKEGNEVESRKDLDNKANIEKEGRRLSQLFAKGDKGKVNVNAMSLEERQTYYMYKQTEYLRRILGNQEKEETDHNDLINDAGEIISDGSMGLYKTGADLINSRYDLLNRATRGTGIRGFIARRHNNMRRKAALKYAADSAFKQNDADSTVGRAGSQAFSKLKNLFTGGGRGTEPGDKEILTVTATKEGGIKFKAGDQLSSTTKLSTDATIDSTKNVRDTDGKTAEQLRKEKAESEYKAKILEYLGSIDESTGGLDDLVVQEDGSKKKGIFGALSNLVGGFSSIFGKKGLITAAFLVLAPFIIKNLPKLLDFLKNGLGDFIKDIWDRLTGNNGGTSANNKTNDENGDGVDDDMPSRGLNNRENGRSFWGSAKHEFSHLFNLYDEDGTIKNSTLPKARLLQVLGRKIALSGTKVGFEHGSTKAVKGIANVFKAGGNRFANYFGNAEKAGNKILSNSNRMLRSGAINADDYAKLANDTITKYGSKSTAHKLGQSAIDNALELLQNGVIGPDEYDDIVKKVTKGASSHFDDVRKGQAVIKDAQKLLQSGAISADDYTKVYQKTLAGLSDDAAEGASRFAKSTGGKILSNAKGAVKNIGSNIGTKLTTKADGNKNLLGKVTGYLDDVLKKITSGADNLISKLTGKTGNIGGSISKLFKGLTSTVTKFFDDIAFKINGILGTHITGAALSAGLTEAAFITFGAINGATGTAKLFHVNKDDVDGTMTAISSIFGGISQTLPGAIADVCFQLYYSVTGQDLLSEIAVTIYNTIMKLTGQDDRATAMNEARASFHEEYLSQRDEEIKSQYEAQLAAGIIPPNTTYEEFCKGAIDGTYKVAYDSEADWNAKVNASLGDKAMSVLGKVGKNLRNSGIGNALLGTKEQTVYTSKKDGTKYTKGSDGMYYATDASGKQIGDGISEEAFTKKGFDSEVIQKKSGLIQKGLQAAFKGVGTVVKGVGKVIGTIADGLVSFAKMDADLGSMAVKGDIAGIWKYDVGSNFTKGGEEGDDISPFFRAMLLPRKALALIGASISKLVGGIGKGIGDAISSVTGKLSEAMDAADTRLKEVNDIVSTDGEKKFSRIWNVKPVMLKKDTNNVGGMANAMVALSKMFGIFKVIVDKIGSVISPIGNAISDKVENIKDGWNTSTIGSAINTFILGEDKANELKTNSAANQVEKNQHTASSGNTHTGSSGGFGGRGAYYSQDDPRFKNISYGNDGATLGDSGCGPMALGTVMSDITGRNIPPTALASLAEMTGDRDRTGTNANFISKASSMFGLGTRQALAPSTGYLANELARGNEVVLLGRNGGYGGRGSSGLFTDQGHYIVATGMDRNGNVSYKDSLHGVGTTNIAKLAPEVGMSWSFGGSGNVNGIATADWEAIPGGKADVPRVNGIAVADWEKIPYGERVSFGRTIDSNLNARPASAYGKSTSTTYKSTKNNDWIGKRTIDTSTAASSNYRPNEAYAPEDRYNGVSAEYQRWLDTIAYVKEYASKKSPRYDQGGSVTVTTKDGVDIKMRTDCSGFVSTCLVAYGALPNGKVLSSSGFTAKDNMLMSKSGFIPMSWPGWENLIAGDIIAKNGHVEIFAKNEGDSHKVWNWGSTASASNPGITSSSKPNYSTVWRHPEAAPGATFGDGYGGMSSEDVNSTLSATAGVAGGAKAKKKVGLFEGIGNFMSAFTNKILTGDMSAVTLADIKGETDGETAGGIRGSATIAGSYHGPGSDTDMATGSSGTSTSYNTDVPTLSADETRTNMYAKLRELGLSPVATAGVLGNFHAESGIKTNRFEGDYTKMAKSRGGMPGIFASNDTMNEYTQALINSYRNNGTKINEDAYIVNGNYYPGIGLAQWTGSRGKNLMDYATSKGSSWGDYGIQSEFMVNEFKNNAKWKGMLDQMNEMTSPAEAANKFLDLYEHNGKDGWHNSVQTDVHVPERQAAAEAIYKEFGGAGRGRGGRGTYINKSNVIPYTTRNNVSSVNTPRVTKTGGFGARDSVSKKIKEYSWTDKDIAAVINYLRLIADNTMKFDDISKYTPADPTTNNYNIISGNNQQPLSNYSTKADPIANVKSTRAKRSSEDVAAGGLKYR